MALGTIKRYMLASAEELLVVLHPRRTKTTLILEPGTQAAKEAALPGAFKTLLSPQRGEELLGNPHWSLYTVAAALSGAYSCGVLSGPASSWMTASASS